jgi:uncharacterized protein (TIGR00266 family)
MHFEIAYQPAHSLATAHLAPGESVRAEASAMVSMTNDIQTSTTARGAGGGLLGGLKRAVLGGESFFTNLFTAQAPGAHVTFAPNLCGSMVVHDLDGGESLLVQGSSYVASPDTVRVDTQFQGLKALFSGESFFFLEASGRGPVLLNAFGAIEKIDLNGSLIVDTGHLVAFTSGIRYSIDKAAKGWITSYLSGEGLVLRVEGRGTLYVQSRNPGEFGKNVGGKLPPREA